MKKAQSITHKITMGTTVYYYVLMVWFIFTAALPLLRYPLRTHTTRNCSLPHLFCCAFFYIPFSFVRSFARTPPSILVSYYYYILRFTISFSVDFVRSGLFYAYFAFSSNKIVLQLLSCCTVHIQFSSLCAEIVGRYYLDCFVSYKIDAIMCIIETHTHIYLFSK